MAAALVISSVCLLSGTLGVQSVQAAPPPTPVVLWPTPAPRPPVLPSPTPVRPVVAPAQYVYVTPTPVKPVMIVVTSTPVKVAPQAAAAIATPFPPTTVPSQPVRTAPSQAKPAASSATANSAAAASSDAPDPLWLPTIDGTGPTPRPLVVAPTKTAPKPAATPRPATSAQASAANPDLPIKSTGTSGKAPLNLTPTGSAAGGGTSSPRARINTALLRMGIIILTAGGAWGVYYFLRPARD